MPKGYWIVRADVTDMEQFKKYAAANGDALRKHGAKFLARAGQFTLVEGTTRARNTIVEFPSYQAALEHRLSASQLDLVIVEGYDGLQPS